MDNITQSKVLELALKGNEGIVFNTNDLRKNVLPLWKKCGYEVTSFMPYDYCYNHKNKDPSSGKNPLFVKEARDRYLYIGPNKNY